MRAEPFSDGLKLFFFFGKDVVVSWIGNHLAQKLRNLMSMIVATKTDKLEAHLRFIHASFGRASWIINCLYDHPPRNRENGGELLFFRKKHQLEIIDYRRLVLR